MALWLLKQEPDCYSFADLERDGETTWDGVANPLARKHLRAARPGDRAFFYHTGKEKSVVGIVEVSAVADEVVKVKPIRRLANPVTLAAIKADPAFADWELVKQSRLSVMPVDESRWKKIESMAAGTSDVAPARAVGKHK
jgi:predicted RNA-binding protein with PUA-like domain